MKITQIEKTLADTMFGYGTTEIGHMLSDVINGDTDKYSSFDLGAIKRLRPDFERILKTAKAIIAKNVTVEAETIKTLTTDEVEILVVAGVFQRMRECGFNSIAAGWSKFWNEPETKPAQKTSSLIKEPELLNTIFKQALATAACFEDEEKGIRQYAATDKAMRVIESNETITFENGVLRFFSLESGKFRIVTKNGCHTTCECRGIYSYHAALYNLLDEYTSILKKREAAKKVEPNDIPYLPNTIVNPRRMRIGGVWVD